MIGAFTLPVPTLSWLSPVVLLASIGVASILGGVAAASPLVELIDRQLAA